MRGFWLILFLVLPAMAQAQLSVTVRAGEHADFTRVTFALSKKTDWSFEGNRLLFSEDVEIDVSEAFTRIGRARLQSLTTGKRHVELELGCPCAATFFQASDTLIAADIKPSETPEEAAETQTVAAPNPVGSTTDLRHLLLAPHLEALKSEAQVAAARSEPEITSDPSETGQEIDDAELSNSIARAATLGLVSTVADTPVEEHHVNLQFEALNSALAQTSTRISAMTEPGRTLLAGDADTCPPNSTIPKLTPVEFKDKGKWIIDLLTEVGRIDDQSLTKTADAFLSLGFGAEAMEILSVSADEEPYRKAIALYLDGESSAYGPFTQKHLLCDADTALWALLFLKSDADLEGVDLAALVARFQTWPFAVRKHIGPGFSSELFGRDRYDLARIVVRLSTVPNDSSGLALAELEAAQGNIKTALDHLEPPTDGDQSPEFVVARMRLRLDAGLTVSEQDIEIARSLLREHKDLPIGNQLRNAVIEAYVLTGDLQQAIEVSGLAAGNLRMGEALFGHALRYLPPEEYAWAALAYWKGNEAALSEETNKGITAAMSTIGFSECCEAPEALEPFADPILDMLAGSDTSNVPLSDRVSVQSAASLLDLSLKDTARIEAQIAGIGGDL